MSYRYSIGPEVNGEQLVSVIKTTTDQLGGLQSLNSVAVKANSKDVDEFVSSYKNATSKDYRNNGIKALIGGLLVGGYGYFKVFKGKDASGLSRLGHSALVGLFGCIGGGLFSNSNNQDRVCESFISQHSK